MHSINLHGPWNLTFGDPSATPLKWKYPCLRTKAPAELERGFQISRRFNAPTGIDDGQLLKLEFRFHVVPVALEFNDQRVELTDNEFIQIDISGRLKPWNLIHFRFSEFESSDFIPDSILAASKLIIH